MTNAECMMHHFTNDSGCPLCVAPVEDLNHLLRSALMVWAVVVKRDRLHHFLNMDCHEPWLAWLLVSLASISLDLVG
ncbi:hypothetical protein V6N12_016444 [Hibiscus sabdariffa]|uniref:Uncharacterized protein n=1 Tax=Hibiscus sabdariffa TaxID=183260 RepID=A0ABR2CE22_9ROSI